MSKVNILLYRRQDPDTVAFIKEHFKSDFELQVFGNLDGFSDEDIRNMAAEDEAKGAPVDLNDGSCVYADHEKLDVLARKKALEIKSQNSDPTVMFCTIPWKELEDLDNVLCPSRIMEAMAVSAMPRGGTIGVVQPLEKTAHEEIKHWRELGHKTVSACAAAEDEHFDEFSHAVKTLAQQGADVIVLDCLGYTNAHYALARKLTSKPIILPMDAIGRTLDSVYQQ